MTIEPEPFWAPVIWKSRQELLEEQAKWDAEWEAKRQTQAQLNDES